MSLLDDVRYSPWCHRRVLVNDAHDRFNRATIAAMRFPASPLLRDAVFYHEFTGCDGLELVVCGNAELRGHVPIGSNMVLVPCFPSEDQQVAADDPLLKASLTMQEEARFVYDGWIRVSPWSVTELGAAIRTVEESLSLFCLSSRSSFAWQPKYRVAEDRLSTYVHDQSHLDDISEIARSVERATDIDRQAIYRSIGWLNQGIQLHAPQARFLLSILAIESLGTFIEEEAEDTSPLAALRADKRTRSEKRTDRARCINETWKNVSGTDPVQAVLRSYFDCIVGIKVKLRRHLNTVLDQEPEFVTLLFDGTSLAPSLYELRHTVAHGGSDVLNDTVRSAIASRVWDAERIARRYIVRVLEKAYGLVLKRTPMNARVFMQPSLFCVSREEMYRGPTHMALIYAGRMPWGPVAM